MTQHPNPKICILGGGFGGLYTALRLHQFPWHPGQKPEITLVDQRDRFVFLPLLYELITGELESWEIAPPFAELFANTDIKFCQDLVTEINLETQEIYCQNCHLSYDYLVLALGSETPLQGVPGVAEFAFPFRSLSDAYRLEEKIRLLEASQQEKIRVAVVGGGYSGVELACKIADRFGDRGRLRLIERGDAILRTSPSFNQESATQALNQRGIWVDLETSIEAITADTISLEYKEQIDILPVDLVVWTVGGQVPNVIKNLPVKQNDRGQITTKTTLQLLDHPEIFAVGDITDCQDADGQKVPATGQVALQQADYTAWNLWAAISGRPLLPFRYQPLGEMITLGLDHATLAGLGITLNGQAAHLIRRLIYLYRLPTLEHQIKVGFSWMLKPLRELLLTD